MSTDRRRKIRRIAADQGLDGAHEAPLEEVALWIARRFQLLADHATDVVSIHDAEGRIEYVSPAATRVLGRPPDELVGRLPFVLAHPDDREGLRKALVRLVEGDDVPDQIFRAAEAGDEVRWLEVSGRVVDDGGERRMIAVTRDVTRRRRLEDAAARTRRLEAVGRLAGGVAHNLNNRLMTMKGELTLLGDELDRDEHGRALERIGRALDRAADLVRDLLAFGSHGPSEVEVLDLGRFLRELRPRLESAVGPGVELRLELPDRPLRVEIDQEGLGSVIRILVENADEAMPGGGRITLALERWDRLPTGELRETALSGSGPWAVLTVADTGPGVAPDVRERIFEPFTSGGNRTEKRGLGLSVAHRVVRGLGGAIAVESTEGDGARVRVAIPLV